MAAVFALAAIFAFAAVGGANAIDIGGATSVEKYVSKLCTKSSAYGSYKSVGSGAGINGFLSGAYDISFSDVALSASQDVQAGGKNKITVPFTLATYSFFTKKAKGLRLTTDQVATIYTSGLKWSAIKAGLSGTVVPVARADSSGTTEVICRWLSKSSKWPASIKSPCGPASWNGKAGINKATVYKSGTDGIGSFLIAKAGANAIGYMQTGAGVTVYKLSPAAVMNLAKKYVTAAGTADRGDIYGALPRNPKALNLPWNDVDLIDVSGSDTYPICALVYEFAKLRGGGVVKSFVLYSVSSAGQNLAPTYFFDPLPSSYQKLGKDWGSKIN